MRHIFLLGLTLSLASFGAHAQVSARVSEALDLQRAMAERNPNDPEILNDLGNLYSLTRAWPEAEAAYRASIALDPHRVATHYNLALALQEAEQTAEAALAMEAAVDLDPTNPRALYQLGNIYLQRDERALAIDAFARAFRHDPNLAVPSVNPQVIDNPVLTEALLHAYDRRSRAAMAPRIYERPQRVSDLLIPEKELLKREPEPAQANEPAREPRRIVTPKKPRFKPPAETPDEAKAKQESEKAPAFDLEDAFANAKKKQKELDEANDGWGADLSGWGAPAAEKEEAEAPSDWGDLETEEVRQRREEDRQRRIDERQKRRQELREAARERAQEAAKKNAETDGDGSGVAEDE